MCQSSNNIIKYFCAHFYPYSHRVHCHSRFETYYSVRERTLTIFTDKPIKFCSSTSIGLSDISINTLKTYLALYDEYFEGFDFISDYNEAPFVEPISPLSETVLIELFPNFDFYPEDLQLMSNYLYSCDGWFNKSFFKDGNLKYNGKIWYRLDIPFNSLIPFNYTNFDCNGSLFGSASLFDDDSLFDNPF